MNQCVPDWGFEDSSNPPALAFRTHSSSISSTPDVPTLDYQVAELTWENGQLFMQGLGLPRASNKPQSTTPPPKYTWEKPRAGGTLEAIVDQATNLPTCNFTDLSSHGDDLVPWLCHHKAAAAAAAAATATVSAATAAVPVSASASATMTMDALVPCSNTSHRRDHAAMQSASGTCGIGCLTRVGSSAGADDTILEKHRVARVWEKGAHERSSRDHNSSGSGSATFRRERDLSPRGFTGTSLGSQGNTSSGKDGGKSTTGDEHDSVCHSRPQREARDEEDKKKSKGKSTVSAKRSRAAAIHNQSERRRRDKINQRMKTLQKLVPNSSKTDKASMLDEVIEYLKQLQGQIHMMSRVSPMMMPLAMQQQLQMAMMNPMGMGMGMGMPGMGLGMGMGMGVLDLNSIAGRSTTPAMPHVLHPSAFMPLPSWEVATGTGDRVPAAPSLMTDPMLAFLACQSQPMTMDAYSRMAAMFQQMHQQPPQGHGSKS